MVSGWLGEWVCGLGWGGGGGGGRAPRGRWVEELRLNNQITAGYTCKGVKARENVWHTELVLAMFLCFYNLFLRQGPTV